MNETGRMIQVAADGGAAEVLGMVLEHQARERSWMTERMLEGSERDVALLREQVADQADIIETMRRRLAWLMGVGTLEPEDLRFEDWR